MEPSTTDYSDVQMMQELMDFFGWKPKAVRELSHSELAAWKKHAIALRQVGFWWVPSK